MMDRSKVGRIADGFVKAITRNKPKYFEERIKQCKGCEHLTKINTCGLCGCFVNEKTRVMEEACPDNRWGDIKTYIPFGISMKSLKDDQELVYDKSINKMFITMEDVEKDATVSIQFLLVNNRGDFDLGIADVTDIRISGCNCFTTVIHNKNLENGESTRVSMIYNRKLKSDVSKNYIITADVGGETISMKVQIDVKLKK